MEKTKTKAQFVQDLRSVLIKITSGEYRHNQESYHCGTASCIAGWMEIEAISKFNNEPVESVRENMELYSTTIDEDGEPVLFIPDSTYLKLGFDDTFSTTDMVLNLLKDSPDIEDFKNFIYNNFFSMELTLPEILNNFNGLAEDYNVEPLDE